MALAQVKPGSRFIGKPLKEKENQAMIMRSVFRGI
jgi:hypothetical protein